MVMVNELIGTGIADDRKSILFGFTCSQLNTSYKNKKEACKYLGTELRLIPPIITTEPQLELITNAS